MTTKNLSLALSLLLSGCAAAASYRLPISAADAPRYFQPIGVCANEAGLSSVQHPSSVNVKYNDSVWIQYMVSNQTYDMVIVGEDPAQDAKKKGDELFACAQKKGPGEMPATQPELTTSPVTTSTPDIAEPAEAQPAETGGAKEKSATPLNETEMACTQDHQCPNHNCTKGFCRSNATGAACSQDAHCTSMNCSKGLCQTNDRGAACSQNVHCTSHNCTKNLCQ